LEQLEPLEPLEPFEPPARRAGGPDFAKVQELLEASERATLKVMRDFVFGGGIFVYDQFEADSKLIHYLDNYATAAQRRLALAALAAPLADPR
jgi:hypothetical protein